LESAEQAGSFNPYDCALRFDQGRQEVIAMKSHTVRRAIFLLGFGLLMAATASAANREKVLHQFLGKPAQSPDTTLVADGAGNLYGTTLFGGAQHDGTVYELSPRSGGGWTYHVLHVFRGPDGASPQGKLVLDSLGNLYGTTYAGGAQGCGTVYQLAPAAGQWGTTTLHDFTCQDGFNTVVGLTFDSKGNLYGGNTAGGANFGGVAFTLAPGSHGQWSFTVIHDFTDGEGDGPSSSLVFDSKGNLYGGNITGIFVLTPNSNGTWTESTAYTFNSTTDGQSTYGELTFDPSGNLYGANAYGGEHFPTGGAAFMLSPTSGGWSITVLHSFGKGNDGHYPYGGLILDAAGNAYGTTGAGGSGQGVVFKLTPGTGGHWSETILHTFNGGRDGGIPTAGLLLDSAGNLYGTTASGGNGTCTSGCGVVFELAP
jgi:uncharacterized repeat protein (TIGR03803 family)